MLIRPMSDLHLAYYKGKWFPPKLETDKETVLVIAGDIWEGTKFISFAEGQSDEIFWLETISKQFKAIVFVAGNHDYWGECLTQYPNKLIDLTTNMPNVFFLENDYCIIDDVVFIGSTLWTDFNHHNPISLFDWSGSMNDSKYIKNHGYSKLKSLDIYDLHQKSVHAITDLDKNFHDKKRIWVTHHAPSLQSASRIYHDNNEYYVSDLDDLILHQEPDMIIHGHLHENFDYMIGETRVICNPKGYKNENNHFDNKLLIEL